MSVTIIAEAGVNHNGDINKALELVSCAAQAGADYIKFQTFVTEENITRGAPKAEYQKLFTNGTESQFEMVKKLELNADDFYRIHDACAKHKIGFLSTAFDIASARLLNTIGVDFIKIPSGDINNLPLLRQQASFKKPFVVSTGMAELNEIQDCLDLLNEYGIPKSDITLLHCTTEYPAPYQSINLRAMQNLKHIFNVQVGYSDHTQGIEVSLAATALGAQIIEKHFTLDKNLPGPDHQASLDPDELKNLVEGVRNIEMALGTSEKKLSPCEYRNRDIARKSIVARTNIKAGDLFSEVNLAVKRPGTGINPMQWDVLIGQPSSRPFKPDELIEL